MYRYEVVLSLIIFKDMLFISNHAILFSIQTRETSSHKLETPQARDVEESRSSGELLHSSSTCLQVVGGYGQCLYNVAQVKTK